MNTNSLEYVLAVVRHKSFSKAAASIPISQQGLSKSIAKLERDLGFTLFKREGRFITLTSEASKLMPCIEQVVDAQNNLQQKAASIRGAKTPSEQRAIVLMSAFFALEMLKDLDEELVASGFKKPLILEAEASDVIKAIQKSPANTIGIVNLPLSHYNVLPEDGSIVFEELFSSQIMAMATAKFFPPRKKSLSMRDMRTLPLSYPNYPVMSDIADELFAHYRPQNIVFRTSNVNKIDKSVLSGESVALTDSIVAYLHRDDTSRTFVKFDHPVYSNVGLLYSPSEEGMEMRKQHMNAIAEYMASLMGLYVKRYPPKLKDGLTT